ncbi:MAG: hypothetical protein U0Q11_11685 [Vicinamibacterales bacterium]
MTFSAGRSLEAIRDSTRVIQGISPCSHDKSSWASLCMLLAAASPAFAQGNKGGGQRPADEVDGMADAVFDRLDKYLQDQKAKRDAEEAKRRQDDEARKKAEEAAKKKKHVTPMGGVRKQYRRPTSACSTPRASWRLATPPIRSSSSLMHRST